MRFISLFITSFLMTYSNFCFAGQELARSCGLSLSLSTPNEMNPKVESFLRKNPQTVELIVKELVKSKLLFEGGAFKHAFKETITENELADASIKSLPYGSSEIQVLFAKRMVEKVLTLYGLRHARVTESTELKEQLNVALDESKNLSEIDQSHEDFQKTRKLLARIIELENGEDFLTETVLYALPTYVEHYRTFVTSENGKGVSLILSTILLGVGGSAASVITALNVEMGFLIGTTGALFGSAVSFLSPAMIGSYFSDRAITKKSKQFELIIKDYYQWNPIVTIPGNLELPPMGLVSTYSKDSTHTPPPTASVQMSKPASLPVHVVERETVKDTINLMAIEEMSTKVDHISSVSDVMAIGIQVDGAIDALARSLFTDRIVQAQGISKLIPLIDAAIKNKSSLDSTTLTQLVEFRQKDLIEILRNVEEYHKYSSMLISKIDQLTEAIQEDLDLYNDQKKVYSELIIRALKNKVSSLKMSRDLITDLTVLEGKIHQLVITEEDNLNQLHQLGLKLRLMSSSANTAQDLTTIMEQILRTTNEWVETLESLNDPHISQWLPKTDAP